MPKVQLRGWLKTIDKYKKAHLIFISNYDFPENQDDYTKDYLRNYNRKFKEKNKPENVDQKVPEDVDEILLKFPLHGDEFTVQLSNTTKYYSRVLDRVTVKDLLFGKVLCSCTIVPYVFYKTLDDKKQQITGWKIMCKEIRASSPFI